MPTYYDVYPRVWDGKHVTQSPVKLLPHPAYVYTARFHVRVHKVVVTGSYDRIIRVWTLQGSDVHAEVGNTLGLILSNRRGASRLEGCSTRVISFLYLAWPEYIYLYWQTAMSLTAEDAIYMYMKVEFHFQPVLARFPPQ